LKIRCWLRITQDGTVDARKTPVAQENGLVVVPLQLEIPDEAFQPPKMPMVEITLDAAALPKLTVVDDAMTALQGAGIKVKIVSATE
jgi:hypothetical protein